MNETGWNGGELAPCFKHSPDHKRGNKIINSSLQTLPIFHQSQWDCQTGVILWARQPPSMQNRAEDRK